jgi:isoleucyl-tRNA synthetase
LSDPIRPRAVKEGTPLRFESIHHTLLTAAEEDLIDETLERRMDLAQRVSSLVLSLRKKVGIRVRQPLSRIMVPVLSETFSQDLAHVQDLILAEVNVKRIEAVSSEHGVFTKKVRPDYKKLGSRLGKRMKAVAAQLTNLQQEDIESFERNGRISLSVDDEPVELSWDEVGVITEDMPGLLVAQAGDLSVALDIDITEELKAEGYAREFINRVQKLRKEMGLEVTDRILVRVEPVDTLKVVLTAHKDYICREILAVKLLLDDNLVNPQTVDLEGQMVRLVIEVASI